MIVNLDVNEQMRIIHAVLVRRPLPPPSAIIEGFASDPNAFRPITAEEARDLQAQDSQLLPLAGTAAD